MLGRSNPERSEELVSLAQHDVDDRWHYYRQLADVQRTSPGHASDATIADEEDE
jgi:pyruvate-ferredoxin/flavodoxin oxidoreductase